MSWLQDIIFPRSSSFLRICKPQGEIIPVKIDHTFISQGGQFPGHGAAVDAKIFCHFSAPQGQAEGGSSLSLCLHGQIGEDFFPH